MTTSIPQRTPVGAHSLHFGYSAIRPIAGFQRILQNKPNDYGSPYDLERSLSLAREYKLASTDFIDQAMDSTSPKKLHEFLKSQTLGPLEEGSDMVWEAFLYKAIKKGLITPEMAYKTRHEIIDPMRNADLKSGKKPEHPYKDIIKAIEKQIPEKNIRKYKRLSGVPSLEIAKRQLSMGIFKYAILNGETMEEARKIKQTTRKYAIDEAGEFKESIEHRSPIAKHLVVPYTRLFLAFTLLPMRLITMMPELLIEKNLNIEMPRRELFDFEYLKQLFRQELHYNIGGGDRGEKPTRQNPYHYKARKILYKPVEMLIEAWRISVNTMQNPRKASNPDGLYHLA